MWSWTVQRSQDYALCSWRTKQYCIWKVEVSEGSRGWLLGGKRDRGPRLASQEAKKTASQDWPPVKLKGHELVLAFWELRWSERLRLISQEVEGTGYQA